MKIDGVDLEMAVMPPLKAGDIVVLKATRKLDEREAFRFREVLAHVFGWKRPVLILDEGFGLSSLEVSDLSSEFIEEIAQLVAGRLAQSPVAAS